jgi:L-ascorbate metabolism protein UlaG (beta-lactamase superfamily)
MKRNLFTACCLCLAFSLEAEGSGTGANARALAQGLAQSISWLGQACLRIPAGKLVVYTDPLGIPADLPEKADVILITHSHSDHYSKADMMRLAGPGTLVVAPFEIKNKAFPKTRQMKPGDSFAVGDLKIEAVPAYNVVKKLNHPASNNWLGYILTIGGVRLYVAGDTERIPEMKGFRADIAVLPLGQTYTMGSVDEAVRAALDTGAAVAIPYHYGMYEGSAKDAEAFKEALDGKIEVMIKAWKK